MSVYYVYLLRCSDNSLYTGITNNLEQREKRHNTGHGSNYTKARLPTKIVYTEIYSNQTNAAQRERKIKGWTKLKKERLIEGKHPNIKK